ncbi:DUF421 domain-containing protein [Microvirga subterranea]|uniref:Uncharacterized protein DUF421 n=1 Tax=Microvirga subterranea TaxID=186651 RepID=A0A370H4V6_9HYPH|nr:YetF domain-containing protein [Microvirga subterranea]RDI50502.1 uncharacterized protein DUF421 [Microvirga subterranea]
MDSVLRAAFIYFFLLIVFRIAGRRTLSEMTTFDFVLLLIIGEATEPVLLGDDPSITHAALVIITLLFLNIVMSLTKERFKFMEKLMDGVPTIIVEHGRLMQERMNRARVSRDDVMEAARRMHGIERLEQIKYAIVEVSGGITIVPQANG